MQPEQVKVGDWGFLSSLSHVFLFIREADERRENRGRLQSMSNGYSGPGNKSLNFSLDFLVILYRTQVQGGSVLHLVLALRGGN